MPGTASPANSAPLRSQNLLIGLARLQSQVLQTRGIWYYSAWVCANSTGNCIAESGVSINQGILQVHQFFGVLGIVSFSNANSNNRLQGTLASLAPLKRTLVALRNEKEPGGRITREGRR